MTDMPPKDPQAPPLFAEIETTRQPLSAADEAAVCAGLAALERSLAGNPPTASLDELVDGVRRRARRMVAHDDR